MGGWVNGWAPLKHRQPASCRLVACPLTACWLRLGCLAGLSCMHVAPHLPPPSPVPPTACPPTCRSTALCGAGGWRRRGQRRQSQLPCHAAYLSAYLSLPHCQTSRRRRSPGAAAADEGWIGRNLYLYLYPLVTTRRSISAACRPQEKQQRHLSHCIFAFCSAPDSFSAIV